MQTQPHTHFLPGRDNLDQFRQTYLKESRSWFSPDVVLLQAPDGIRFVMKDWASRPWLFRRTWCRVAARREIRVYETLRGMKGVPQLISKLENDHGFIMEWLDARPLPSRKFRDLLGTEFFENLEAVLNEMHRRGIAHGDLRRRNILRGIDGSPNLIDFETAVHTGKGPIRKFIFNEVAHIDIITMTKIRARYFPDKVTTDDAHMLKNIPWHLKLGRYIRQDIYGLLTRKGRRKRAKKNR